MRHVRGYFELTARCSWSLTQVDDLSLPPCIEASGELLTSRSCVETATPGEICRSAPYLIFPLLGRWNVHSSVLVAPAANVQAEFARQAQGGFPDQVAQVRQKEFAQHG